MEFLDIVDKESGCAFCCDYCVRQNKVYSFRDGIHNSHDGIMSRGLQEFNHKINTEHIPLFVQNREWLKLANRRVSSRFYPEVEFDHSKECTAPLVEPQSSHVALAIGFSWSPFRFFLQMLDKIFCSIPVSSTPSRAHTTRNSGQRRTMFSLSKTPFLWSALLDNASGLPMVHPGQ